MRKGKYILKQVPINTNNITSAIIDFLNHAGHLAMRINTEGQFEEVGNSEKLPDSYISGYILALEARGYKVGRWRKSGSTEGVSDILCCLNPSGRMLAIEVKFGQDRVRPKQAEFLKDVAGRGGLSTVARTYEGFLEYYNSTIKPLLI